MLTEVTDSADESISGSFVSSPAVSPIESLLPLKEKYVSKSAFSQSLDKESYRIIKPSSEGGFGKTFLVLKDSSYFILKEISYNKNTDQILSVMEESIVSLSASSNSSTKLRRAPQPSPRSKNISTHKPTNPAYNDLLNSLYAVSNLNSKNYLNLISAHIEINTLKYIKNVGCRHDIACYIDHFIDYKADSFCIITQKFPQQGDPAPTMNTWLSSLSDSLLSISQFTTLFLNILTAFSFLHSVHVFHNDIKPSNILIDVHRNFAIHVIDFGSSCTENYCISTKTDNYFHPQGNTLNTKSYGRRPSKNLDIYSLGILFNNLISSVDIASSTSIPNSFLVILNTIQHMKNININDTQLSLPSLLSQVQKSLDKPSPIPSGKSRSLLDLTTSNTPPSHNKHSSLVDLSSQKHLPSIPSPIKSKSSKKLFSKFFF
jgi:serine/threonine protein kinase